MAKYDPQRPRRSTEHGQETQVDALLDSLAPTDEEPAPDTPQRFGTSDVPVAPPPTEGTANRAVLGAGLAAAVLALIILLVLRKRRS